MTMLWHIFTLVFFISRALSAEQEQNKSYNDTMEASSKGTLLPVIESSEQEKVFFVYMTCRFTFVPRMLAEAETCPKYPAAPLRRCTPHL